MARSYDQPVAQPIGSLFTGAAGGANSKLAVEANGQNLSRAEYPELSSFYSSQTSYPFSSSTNLGVNNVSLPYAANMGNNGYLISDQTSSYVVYTQYIYDNSSYGIAFWSSANGNDWKLMTIIMDGSIPLKVKAIGTSVYICTTKGLYRTTDGLTVTKIRSGGVVDIAYSGSTFILLSSAGNAGFSTTDFITYTPLTLPGTSHFAIEYLGTTWYLFRSGSTSVWSSTNNGSTWTVSGQTLTLACSYNGTKVLNNILFTFPSQNNQTVFLYNSNPVSNAWSSSATTINTTNQGLVCSMIYDSSTTTYVVTTGRTSNNVGEFGWIFTNIANAGSQLAAAVGNPSGDMECIAYALNSNKFYLFGGQHQVRRSTWATTPNTFNGADSYQNPTFPYSTSYYNSGSTFPDGTRALIKGTNSTGNQFTTVCVEISGYFVPLVFDNSSNKYYSFQIGGVTPFAHTIIKTSQGWAVLECAGSNLYWGTYSTSYTKVGQSSTGTPNYQSNAFVIGCPNDGIYFWDPAATSSRTVYFITPTSTNITSFTWTLGTSTQGTRNAVATTNNEIIITEHDAPNTVTEWYTMKEGGVSTQKRVSLFNTTGGAVSVSSGTKIFKLGTIYYAVDSTNVYISFDGNIFTNTGVSGGASVASGPMSYTQVSNDYILGNYPLNLKFGAAAFTTINTGTSTTRVNPPYFAINPTTIYCGIVGSSYQIVMATLSLPFDGTTNFQIPRITTSTTNTSNYIVAR